MSKTMQEAGAAVAIYVDDAQGRRILMATRDRGAMFVQNPVLVGTTRPEIRAAIKALRELMEELPREEPTVTPPPVDMASGR